MKKSEKILSHKHGDSSVRMDPVCGMQVDHERFTLIDGNKGEIIINNDCSTSFPGIFAAGDVTDTFGKRIIIAAGEGAKAAVAAKKHIVDLRRKGIRDRATVK